MRVQSRFLLGRLSETYINLAKGMGNSDKIDSGEGGVLLHGLRPQSHSPSDNESCGYVACQITPVREKLGLDLASVRNGFKQNCRVSRRPGLKLDYQPTEK